MDAQKQNYQLANHEEVQKHERTERHSAAHDKEALRRGEVTTNELRMAHGLSALEDGVAGNRLKQFD